jgi:hypothetical protein
VTEIRRVITCHKLALREFSIDEVKKFLSPHAQINKQQMMEDVAAKFPFLYPDLERERKHRNPYLVRMFEAVALGLAALNETDSKPRKVGGAK